MQTVILVHNRQTTGTLHAAHGKEMHCFVVHAHQPCETCRLFRRYIVGMQLRTQRGKAGILLIKIIAAVIIFQVRIQSEKTRQTHQKDQMKIGKATAAFIQPDNGMLQISE